MHTFFSFGTAIVLTLTLFAQPSRADDPWVEYQGGNGPGKGKHIVFVTGDDEYRSEESMPMLAKLLAKEHGFTCTVLFAINKQTGEIDPSTLDNIPGLEKLDHADQIGRASCRERVEHAGDGGNVGRRLRHSARIEPGAAVT